MLTDREASFFAEEFYEKQFSDKEESAREPLTLCDDSGELLCEYDFDTLHFFRHTLFKREINELRMFLNAIKEQS